MMIEILLTLVTLQTWVGDVLLVLQYHSLVAIHPLLSVVVHLGQVEHAVGLLEALHETTSSTESCLGHKTTCTKQFINKFQGINEIILRLYSIYGNRELQAIPLHDRYNNPVEIEKNDTFNQMVKGLILQPAGEVDTSFSIGVI